MNRLGLSSAGLPSLATRRPRDGVDRRWPDDRVGDSWPST